MRTPLRGLGPPGDHEVRDLLTGDNHRYATWDAAYVLGSLSAADRREFEAHLAGCLDCRDAVAELSGMPALLSQLDSEDVAAINQSGPTSALLTARRPGPGRRPPYGHTKPEVRDRRVHRYRPSGQKGAR